MDQRSDTSVESDVDMTQAPGDWESRKTGLVVDWRLENVDAFIAVANSGQVPVKAPQWVSEIDGKLTTAGFMADVLTLLEPLAGGHEPKNTLQPNSPSQLMSLCKMLGNIEADPFVQACMALLPDDAGLAGLLRIFASPELPVNAETVRFPPPPPPMRRVFY